ncbi:hypothetical protein IJL65_00295 [bacterium]|nr:hypothetical protein [bacterium]
MKLFVSTGWSQYANAYQYFSITSLYHVQENVVLEDVIVVHSVGEIIVNDAGITTLKSIDFSWNDVSDVFHESILIVNLYFHVWRFDNVILQLPDLYKLQSIFEVWIQLSLYVSFLNVVPEIS